MNLCDSEGQLAQPYRRLVHSIPASVYGLRPADAEDIYQDVMVKLLTRREQLRTPEEPTAWLAAVTHNACRSLLRRRARQAFHPVDPSTLDSVEGSARPAVARSEAEETDAKCLGRALARLEPVSRDLLTALFLEQPTPAYAEIAARLQLPLGSIGPTRARSLAKLRRLYEEEPVESNVTRRAAICKGRRAGRCQAPVSGAGPRRRSFQIA